MNESETDLAELMIRIEATAAAIAGAQQEHGEQQRLALKGIAEILRLLAPKETAGPSLEELLGHMIGQLTELTGYARESIGICVRMEESLPGNVMQATKEAGLDR